MFLCIENVSMSKRTFAAICLLLAISVRTAAQDDPASQAGQAMFAKAISIGTLAGADAPSMTIKAVISVAQPNAGPAKGTYEMLWLSSKRWREEVRFGNYSRIRVANPGGYWQSSSAPFRPYFMSELDKMIDASAMVGAVKHESFGKVQEKQVRNIHARCIKAKSPNGDPGIKYCFDAATGSLIQIDFEPPEFGPPQLVDRVEYDDIRQRGDKLIPFRVETFQQGKVFMTYQIAEIAAAPADPAAAFNIPPNSAFWPTCKPSRHFELLNRVQPQYPKDARANHESGRVVLYGVIEGDGSVSNLQVIVSAGQSLNAAAMDAVRQWRYKPQTCEDAPTANSKLEQSTAGGAIRAETSIEVIFALRR
jgi:TonB family protein